MQGEKEEGELQEIIVQCTSSQMQASLKDKCARTIEWLKKQSTAYPMLLLFQHPPSVSFLTLCTQQHVVVVVCEEDVAFTTFCTQCRLRPALSLCTAASSASSSTFFGTAAVKVVGSMLHFLTLSNYHLSREDHWTTQLIVHAPNPCVVDEYSRLIKSIQLHSAYILCLN